jgi:hypothetical protein
MRTLRLVTALILAPIAATFVASGTYVLGGAIYQGEPPMGGWHLVPMWIATVWAYLAIFGLLATFVIGLPLHIYLYRSNQLGLANYLGAGALGGAVISGAMFAFSLISDPFAIPFAGALSGGLTGLFAWLIRRPDRDAANLTTSTS